MYDAQGVSRGGMQGLKRERDRVSGCPAQSHSTTVQDGAMYLPPAGHLTLLHLLPGTYPLQERFSGHCTAQRSQCEDELRRTKQAAADVFPCLCSYTGFTLAGLQQDHFLVPPTATREWVKPDIQSLRVTREERMTLQFNTRLKNISFPNCPVSLTVTWS